MRPLRLVVKGFKPFVERQEIDFTELDFFLVKGPTGSGKSSILDAIVYALFGKLEGLSKEEIINRASAEALVDFSFTLGGEEYRVVRRLKRRGAADVRFYEGGRLRPMKTTAVNERIESLLGLRAEQFQTIFYLPQGRYDGFIKGRNSDRRKILETLLDLEIYGKLQERIGEEFSNIEGEYQRLKGKLEELQDITPQKVEEIEGELRRLQGERKKLEEELEKERAQLEKLERAKALTEELEAVERKERELLSGDFEEKRKHLRYLEGILPLKGELVRFSELEEELEKIRLERKERERTLFEKREELKETKERIEKLEGLRQKLEEGRERYERIKGLAATFERYGGEWEEFERRKRELRKAQVELEKLKGELQRAREELQNLSKELEEKQKTLSEREGELKNLEGVEILLERARRRDALSEEAKRLRGEVEKAKRTLKTLEGELRKLEKTLSEKREELKKLKESGKVFCAALLAEGLKAGDRCPVCGGVVREVKTAAGGELDLEKLKRLEEEIKTLEEKRTKLLSMLAAEEQNLKGLEERLEKTAAELKEYADLPPTEELRKALLRREELLREVEGLREEVETLKDKKAAAERRGEELRVKVEAEGRRIGELSAIVEGRREEMLKVVKEALKLLRVNRDGLKGKNPFGVLSDLARAWITKFEEKEREISEGLERERLAERGLLSSIEHLGGELKRLTEREREAEEKLRELRKRLEEALGKTIGGEEVRELLQRLERFEELRKEVEEVEGELQRLRLKKEELSEELKKYPAYSEEELKKLTRKVEELEEKLERVKENLTLKRGELELVREHLERKKELEKTLGEVEERYQILKVLREDFRTDRLQTFVINRALEEVVEIASEYFYRLTERYSFALKEEEIRVYDAFLDADRSVKTLSGGETFLASLSFALGFGEYLGTEGRVESLFIDEGFGTLDKERLGKVEEIFEVIRAKVNKMVGVISHLEELAAIFEKRVEVVATARGSKIVVINGS